ncbi:MAG: class I SAM-dependent methyltransferase [Verrucomicrobia bacterium]|nr:class I SAM-dependent methyltransferase [Verrucomicrobiota bacterium]
MIGPAMMPQTVRTPPPKNPAEGRQVCDLCGSGAWQVFASRGRGGMKLSTVICQECGLVYTNPRPTERENSEFYHKRYWGEFKNKTVPDDRFFRRRLPKIRPLLAQLQPFLRPGVKVLEVGCSVGALLWSMRERVGSTGAFVGVEPHEGHAQFARDAKGLDVRTGLLNEVSHKLKPASFDLVVMNHVLEHTISPTDVLLTCKKLLKPHGHLIVEVPNVEAPGSRLSHFFHHAHHHAFSPRTIERLAQKTGFKTRRVDALDGDLPRTRLNAIFEKPAGPDAPQPTRFIRDDPVERAAALRRYERWYWLTAASLRKKVTHWRRQRE